MNGIGDYISREAAIKARGRSCDRDCSKCDFAIEGDSWCNGEVFVVDLLRIPAADVQPVVLCRDCVYAYPYGLEIKCTKHSGRADRFGEDATFSEFHSENWYCADAQRKREKS